MKRLLPLFLTLFLSFPALADMIGSDIIGIQAASSDGPFVTIGNDAGLTQERALTGTTNQVTVTDNGANSTVVLSLPQSIATTSAVTFGELFVDGQTAGNVTTKIQGAPSQSADIFVVEDSAGANMLAVSKTGTFEIHSTVAGAKIGIGVRVGQPGNWEFWLPMAVGSANSFLMAGAAGTSAWSTIDISDSTNLTGTANQVILTGDTLSTPQDINDTADVTFNKIKFGNSRTYDVQFDSSASASTNTKYNWPVNYGSANQYFKTDGTGIMSWSTVDIGDSTNLTGTANQIILTGDTLSLPQNYDTTASPTLGALTLTNAAAPVFVGTATLNDASGNEVAMTLNYTTNKVAGNDTGLLIAMTDTLSPGTSYLLDAQVGGSSKFWVRNDGGVYINNLYATSLQNVNGNISTTPLILQGGTGTATSGSVVAVKIAPVYNEASGTAANTDLLINRTETAVGSGAQLFMDLQVASTSKFKIDNTGKPTIKYESAASPTALTSNGDIVTHYDSDDDLPFVVARINSVDQKFYPVRMATTVRASSLVLPTSGMPASSTVERTTAIAIELAYDDASTECGGFQFDLPKQFQDKDVVVCPDWYSSTATSGDVKWDIQYNHLVDSDGYGSKALTSTSFAISTDGTAIDFNRNCATLTSPFTAGTGMVNGKFCRIGGSGGDTMVGDARLVSIGFYEDD